MSVLGTASCLSDIRGASSAASAVVIGVDAIKPIDPTSAAMISSETASPLTAQ